MGAELSRARRGSVVGSQVLALLGLAFLVVGLVDTALLWWDLRFESVAWEFATVGGTLDAMPMSALGLGLVAYGFLRHPRTGPTGVCFWAFGLGLVTLFLLGLALLLFTVIPAVLETGTDVAREGVRRAVLRHAVQAIVYPLAFGASAFLLWRESASTP